MPTLLLVGSEDSLAVQESPYYLQRVLQECRHCHLADLGHLCLLEDPARVQPIVQHQWGPYAAAAIAGEGTEHDYAAHA